MSLSTRIVAKRLFFSTFAMVLLFLGNRFLAHGQANSPAQKTTSHKVIISATGVDDEDTVAYDGETIEFCPATSGAEFSIIFTTSPFVPLGHGKIKFDERDCGKPLKVALKPHDHPRAFTYVLAVGDKYFDPHVIIMGN